MNAELCRYDVGNLKDKAGIRCGIENFESGILPYVTLPQFGQAKIK